jgi:hypothetical protein
MVVCVGRENDALVFLRRVFLRGSSSGRFRTREPACPTR